MRWLYLSMFFLQWKEADPSDLMDSKLKCVFEQPVEEESQVFC